MSSMNVMVRLALLVDQCSFDHAGLLLTRCASPTLLGESLHRYDQSRVWKASRAEMLCLLAFLLSCRSQTVPAQRLQRQPVQPTAYCKSISLRPVSLRDRRTEDSETLDTTRLLVACSLASLDEEGFKLHGYRLLVHTSSPCELALIAASVAKERAMARLS
jgi:hypothetical protein